MRSQRKFPKKFTKFGLKERVRKTGLRPQYDIKHTGDDDIFLSAVIPVYGAEKYLEKCVTSLLALEGFTIEVIAINDGSPDSSSELLQKLSEEHENLVFIDQKNMGGAPTINKGLIQARGHYVTVIDNDDWVDPDVLREVLQKLVDTPADFAVTKLSKTWNNKQEETYDTAYVKTRRLIKAADVPAIMNDGMYLGKIFNREFLDKNNVRMDPNLLYADRPFTHTAAACANCILLLPMTFYYWRQREEDGNKSITDQQHMIKNITDRIHSARITKFELSARGYDFWLKTIDYFTVIRFCWCLKKSGYSYLREFAKVSRPYLRDIDTDALKNLTPAQKFLLKAIKENSNEIFPLVYYSRKAKHFLKKRVAKMFSSVKNSPNYLTTRAFKQHSKVKLKHYIMNEIRDPQLVFFENNFGKSYGGQPKYIYEEMLKQGKAFRAIWVYQGKRLQNVPGTFKQVARGSDEYFRYLARAKYWVNNIRFTVTSKPEDTIYLQTWHGSPLKRVGLDIEVSGPEAEAREHFLKESANWDYMLAQNEFSSKKFHKAFAVKGKMLPYGYPANDVFYREDVDFKKESFHKEHNIPSDKKLILYAPTWRDDARIGEGWSFSFDLELDLKKMREELGGEYHLLLRLHHLIADGLDISSCEDFVTDVSAIDDTANLLVVTDVLITDYSSIFFDFACSKRTMLFFMYDLEKYANELRGFYLDVHEDLPGPIIKDFNTLVEKLKNLEAVDEEYKDRMDSFYEEMCGEQDGKVAQRIVDEVFADIPTHDKS